MVKLQGTAPNQVPTNADLGSLAYVDHDNVNLTAADLRLKALSKTKPQTAVDVFVYDTSKDSDGGAWRHCTQHTSWYNEGASSTRGSRKEFPAVAVIVAESNKVTIYDGDDPSLPMWMVFTGNTYNIAPNGSATAVTALNGIVCVSGDNSSSSYAQSGVRQILFLADTARKHTVTNGHSGLYKGNIAQRDDGLFDSVGSEQKIISELVNDVAMTVLPDAPTDPATGIAVPTIAVATDGGVSVITDSGVVYDSSSTEQADRITATDNGIWWVSNVFKTANFADYAELTADGFGAAYGSHNSLYSFDLTARPNVLSQSADGQAYGGSSLAGKSVLGLMLHYPNYTDQSEGMSTLTTSTYNTGWMNGDIKLAALADTTAETLSGSELVPSSFSSWLKYEPTDGTVTESAGVITISVNSSSANGYPRASAPLTCEVGKTYVASVSWANNTTGFWARLGTTASTSGLDIEINSAAASGSASLTFVATSTTHYLNIFAEQVNTGAVDVEIASQSVRLADPDRSVNGNGLGVHGSITKAAVATGADVVAYSGFSGSNYLEQPYNSDLDFGTGDFCVMGWVNLSSTGYGGIAHLSSEKTSTANNGFCLFYTPTILHGYVSGSTQQTQASRPQTGVWEHVCFLRRDGTLYLYQNGNQTSSAANNRSASPTDTTANLLVGGYYQSFVAAASNDKFALLRISGTAPTADQIKYIYNDERPLFQPNAKATLYGTSDAVTALAHDPVTDLLHVGTSGGRSVFQGLRRVDNTTTAVSTAISANDSLVVEQ